jgi:putative endonuclease
MVSKKSLLSKITIEKHIKSMKSKIYAENLLKHPETIIKLLEKYKSAC